MLVEENKPLAEFTTLGVGGPARYFVEVRSEEEIAEASAWARGRNLPLFILGGGSNVVVSDSGFDGVVLHIALRGIETVETDTSNEVNFRAAAGENWDGFVQRAVDADCAGVECLAGIPGTVGGTPVQNVGAYGQEVATTIERVRAFDLRDRLFVEFSANECGFSYRRSRFNSTDKGRYLVTQVEFRLRKHGGPHLLYADVKQYFKNHTGDPSLQDVASAVREIRQAKGMLLVEGDADCRSAGSFFKNPSVSEETAARLREVAANANVPLRVFPAANGPTADGLVKVPAAWLIEQAGFAKGYSRGAAGISSRHTLALINRGSTWRGNTGRGNATAADILALAEEIRATVAAKFGIQLEMEPVLVGF